MAVFTLQQLDAAYLWLCRQRQKFPPNADIWDLRFHWRTERRRILAQLNSDQFQFSPLLLVTRKSGDRIAIWSSRDALVIKCLTQLLQPCLPVSPLCEHIAGNGGGKRSVMKTHKRLCSRKYPFICRTDIRGYYAKINKEKLYSQLLAFVDNPVLCHLLYQFIHYSVEEGGEFHTPERGIPRGSALSPLLGAFHLLATDNTFARNPRIRYARYMDDFLIFAPTRWLLRKAVRLLNQHFAMLGFVQHPDKTFIGRVEKGFDWMGFWFDDTGCAGVAPRAIGNFLITLRRLYEQLRHQPEAVREGRVANYIRCWERAFLCRAPRDCGEGSSFLSSGVAMTRMVATQLGLSS